METAILGSFGRIPGFAVEEDIDKVAEKCHMAAESTRMIAVINHRAAEEFADSSRTAPAFKTLVEQSSCCAISTSLHTWRYSK